MEGSVDSDPCTFTLTSRSTTSSTETVVLHSSHPGVRQVWTLQLSPILESQRNFLNGTFRCTSMGRIMKIQHCL